jgi:hypothetical protein
MWKSGKFVGKVGLIKKTFSAYQAKKIQDKKIMSPTIHHLVG